MIVALLHFGWPKWKGVGITTVQNKQLLDRTTSRSPGIFTKLQFNVDRYSYRCFVPPIFYSTWLIGTHALADSPLLPGYLPYPVVAGFLAMIGAAVIKGAFKILLTDLENGSRLPGRSKKAGEIG